MIRVTMLLLTLAACQARPDKEIKATEPQQFSEQLPLPGSSPRQQEAYEIVDADLFGEFYNDRVSFFTKEYPGLKVQNEEVNKVVFYYIDEELFQTKYELGNDITPALIRDHGKFKIRGLNNRNAYFIKRLKSRILYKNEIVSLIDFYQLRWERDEDEVIYRVRRDTIETSYTYIERVKGYRQILKRTKAGLSD